MKKTFWITLLVVVNILAIGVFILWLVNKDYPIIGHDYRLFMPYMLDSYLHQKINGLTVQWYTPSFLGGRPVFSSPQDLQYSLPQFLLWIVNPWIAIQASIIVFVIIGFVATYYFLKRIVGLGSFAGILGAVFFVANGFYFEHMAVGHVTYEPFPLFAVIVVILTHPRLPAWLGGLFLSLTLTVVFYTGIHNIPFFILSILLLFPILYLVKSSLLNGKRIVSIALWGSIPAILLCSSKISAVITFMRLFPRLAQDNYPTNILTGLVGMVRQLLGTMNLLPIYGAAHLILPGAFKYQVVADMAKGTGTTYGYWELDASLSPALLLLLVGGSFSRLIHKPDVKKPIEKKRLIALSSLIIAIWLVVEFTLAKGLIYPYVRNLPVFASLRVNVRNISAFIFPLAVVGAVIFDRWTKSWKSKTWALVIFLLLDGIALAALVTYRWIPTTYNMAGGYYGYNQTDYRLIQATYNEIRYEGKIFPVQTVIPDADTWTVFQQNATSTIDPFNVFFQFLAPGQINLYLHAGSVYDVTGGYYNIINPTGYLFPEANHSKIFEKIAVTDESNFQDFINRRQPKWKLPIYQEALDWISFIVLIIELLVLILYMLKKWLKLPARMHPIQLVDPAD